MLPTATFIFKAITLKSPTMRFAVDVDVVVVVVVVYTQAFIPSDLRRGH